MSDEFFKFRCPQCQNNIEAREQHAETQITCPHCNSHIKIPKPDAGDADLPKADSPPPEEREKPIVPDVETGEGAGS